MTRYLFCFILASLLMLSAACYGNANKFQFWPSAGISWEANKDWTLNYREQLHLNDGGGTLYAGRSDIGVIYKPLADWLDIGFNYGIIYGVNKRARSANEDRISLSAIIRGKILNREFSDRLRIEYRDRDEKSDIWRFRNKFTINRAFENLDSRGMRFLKEGKIKPYVADEIFYSFDGTGFNQNRVYFGFIIKFFKNTSTDFYYAIQTLKNDETWENNNIIGIDFTYYF